MQLQAITEAGCDITHKEAFCPLLRWDNVECLQDFTMQYLTESSVALKQRAAHESGVGEEGDDEGDDEEMSV